MRKIYWSLVIGLLVCAQLFGTFIVSAAPSVMQKIEIMGVFDSDEDPSIVILEVEACGRNIKFAVPKSQVKTEAQARRFLERVVVPRIDAVCATASRD